MHKEGKELIELYNELSETLETSETEGKDSVNLYIKEIIQDFMSKHKRVALYCYGYHTKMLMTDFVSDLREIVCIVDKNYQQINSGFLVVSENELEDYNIDGVIVSSYRFRDEIKSLLYKKHSQISVLDIYDKLKEYNVNLNTEYYNNGPYQTYSLINDIITKLDDEDDTVENLKKLLKLYISIKDFRMSIEIAKKVCRLTKSNRDKSILELLEKIYRLQLETIEKSSEKNVLVLCFDGLRYSDYQGGLLEKTRSILDEKCVTYSKAYAYSTMTFESLVPAFSENTDQRTKYYLKDDVQQSECRFCALAKKQGREIFIYGDGYEYISGDGIKHTGRQQTVAEKFWDLTLDMSATDNGLFYLHELYETHFSYPNPYTKGNMVAVGTAMLFDYLDENGGELQTDYKRQLNDSLRYLDDTFAPFAYVLSCPFLIFADHGNMILDKGAKLSDVKPLQLSAAEEWIRIPWVINSRKNQGGKDDTLVSLMDINDVVCSMLEDKIYSPPKKRSYIKIGRSHIYNPDFKKIYEMLDLGYNGEAFEGFIFDDGYKLMVYSNGKKEIFSTKTDEKIDDVELLMDRFKQVEKDISVL